MKLLINTLIFVASMIFIFIPIYMNDAYTDAKSIGLALVRMHQLLNYDKIILILY